MHDPLNHAPSSREDTSLRRIGWKEYVDLPELGIYQLKAKVDTGARTSALHVSALEELEPRGDGSSWVEIRVPLDRRGTREAVACVRMTGETRVTDSGGHAEMRPIIETEVVLGSVRKRIPLTLTDRRGMLFRMLLGRKCLEGDFLVDVARKYLLGNRPAKASRVAPASAVGQELSGKG